MMADPFAFWRLAWSNAVACALQPFADSFPGDGEPAATPLFQPLRLELATMRLLEERRPAELHGERTLIVAPFAVHEASIADFAEGHSLARALAEAGAGPLA